MWECCNVLEEGDDYKVLIKQAEHIMEMAERASNGEGLMANNGNFSQEEVLAKLREGDHFLIKFIYLYFLKVLLINFLERFIRKVQVHNNHEFMFNTCCFIHLF